MTPQLLWIYIFLAIGLPLFGLICNVVAMKFYPLDKEKWKKSRQRLQISKKLLIKEKGEKHETSIGIQHKMGIL